MVKVTVSGSVTRVLLREFSVGRVSEYGSEAEGNAA